MIEKMKFLSITGPTEELDRVVDQYLSHYEIHLENALSELKSVKDLRPFTETNPHREACQDAQDLLALLPSVSSTADGSALTVTQAVDIVETVKRQLKEGADKKSALNTQIAALQESLDKIIHFCGLDFNIRTILQFHYVRFRFGRISREYYQKFENYVYDSLDTVFYKCQEDQEYIWAVYFVPDSIAERIDAIYSSLHFERFFMPDEYDGTPKEATASLQEQMKQLTVQLAGIEEKTNAILQEHQEDLTAANARLEQYSANFGIRRLAACTKDEKKPFFILCGWMTWEDSDCLQKELEQDPSADCIVENDHSNILSKPPTKLKNPGLIRPFEMFIRMYGLPDYNELDPTLVIALTYSILFGFMFGDMGQGLCLLLGGFLIYRFKKASLGAIISCCGFFSTLFGYLFGSVFGFEEIITAHWLRPAQAMVNLPFIGNLNVVFVVAIALGMGIILMTMVLNMINSLRNHDPEHTWFDTNGLAGFIFYGAVVMVLVLFMTGRTLPAGILLTLMFGVPLLILFFKEPLTALVEKKAEVMPKEKGMFFVQGFFEMFEVLLSYFSNTLSFVRVGAFAVSHAAMMQVVLMLAGGEGSSSLNWAVVIFGNLFVCGMEGLIVGIQVLRLEYYELFSRFYHGTGREFKPYGKTREA